MRIMTIIGARPQFIKASAVSQALTTVGVEEVLVHTGQHYDPDMSDIFFRELDIPKPAINLGIGGGSHGAMIGRTMEGLEQVMTHNGPDWVLVYGDTNSTLAGALAAAKLQIPLIHVEAGLRSFNRRMPEELNRVLTDHASTLLFAPTAAAVQNLANEGIFGPKVTLVGDVMYDVALHQGGRCSASTLAKWGLRPKGYVLATVHRQENTDDPARLTTIFSALHTLARELPVVLPLHPRTRDALARTPEVRECLGSLTVLPPIGYLDMIALERFARVVATDSGGVQKEAFFQGVPIVTLRDETEWIELVEMGWNRLAPPVDQQSILNALHAAMDSGGGCSGNPYGDGDSARKIVNRILEPNGLNESGRVPSPREAPCP
jgi:UDP-GlcNAc3NAcA epimerase